MKALKYMICLVFMFAMNAVMQAQPQTIAIAADTITNTEVDTVPLPYVLDSKGDVYDVSYIMKTTQLSGTTNLTSKHIISNQTTGSNWVITTDSIDHDGAQIKHLKISSVANARSGLRIVGTGTQSSRYEIFARLVRRD